MPIHREEFIERQTRRADGKLSLTVGEESARMAFQQLAIDTYDFLISAGADFVQPFDPWPESAWNPLRAQGWGKRGESSRIELSPDLIKRWEEWNRAYLEIRARNPRLELRDLMQDISESHNASSWPDGYEWRIQDWVDGADPSVPPPFDDRHGIAAPEFFRRLRELRQRCGGWLYSDDELGVVFSPEHEWQKVRAEQEAEEYRRRKEWKENSDRRDRIAIRSTKVLEIARSDENFWGALKSWELQRESKRPAGQPTSTSELRGPVAIRKYTPTTAETDKIENPPVDPIFADFIERVRKPDDVLSTFLIVLSLRSEVRRELDLDKRLGWAGGPAIGQA